MDWSGSEIWNPGKQILWNGWKKRFIQKKNGYLISKTWHFKKHFLGRCSKRGCKNNLQNGLQDHEKRSVPLSYMTLGRKVPHTRILAKKMSGFDSYIRSFPLKSQVIYSADILRDQKNTTFFFAVLRRHLTTERHYIQNFKQLTLFLKKYWYFKYHNISSLFSTLILKMKSVQKSKIDISSCWYLIASISHMKNMLKERNI